MHPSPDDLIPCVGCEYLVFVRSASCPECGSPVAMSVAAERAGASVGRIGRWLNAGLVIAALAAALLAGSVLLTTPWMSRELIDLGSKFLGPGVVLTALATWILARAAPRGRSDARIDRRLAVIAGSLVLLTLGLLIERSIAQWNAGPNPFGWRVVTPFWYPTLASLRWPWSELLIVACLLALGALLVTLLRRRGSAPWSRRIGVAAMAIMTIGLVARWVGGFQRWVPAIPAGDSTDVPTWWILYSTLVFERHMIAEVCRGVGTLLICLVIVELVSATRRRRRRAFTLAIAEPSDETLRRAAEAGRQRRQLTREA